MTNVLSGWGDTHESQNGSDFGSGVFEAFSGLQNALVTTPDGSTGLAVSSFTQATKVNAKNRGDRNLRRCFACMNVTPHETKGFETRKLPHNLIFGIHNCTLTSGAEFGEQSLS
jgi:hypothetical protein